MDEEIDNLNFAEDEEDENNLYDPSMPNIPKKKKKRQIELTEKEKNKIQNTILEMKENLVQVQKTGTMTFKGAGFIANPQVIEFKDFTVGKKVSMPIDVINISYNFNSFHLLPMDDNVIDFFEIDYKPCGRIPAGISTKMTIHFTPIVNEDINTNIKLLSETGMCLIPVKCYSQKCIIEVQKKEIDYGEVILGQEVEIIQSFSSKGAIGCKYRMQNESGAFLGTLMEDEDNEKDTDAELDSSYKDFVERKVILEKENFAKEMKETEQKALEVVMKQKVEEYKENLIKEAKEKYEKEKEEKEKEEAEAAAAQAAQKGAKGKKADKKQATQNSAKENEVELVNGIPPESMTEIEGKVEEFKKNYQPETEEEKQLQQKEMERLQQILTEKYLLKQITMNLIGKFDPYSKKKVPIVLNAKFIGTFSININLNTSEKNQSLLKNPTSFVIKFTVIDMPISSEKKIYDLDYIIYDTIFREKLVLINKSEKLPYKVQLFFHKDLNDFIELNPNLGYVQPNSTFDIWIKLNVGQNVKNLISFFKKKKDEENPEDGYVFPIKLVINNTKIPLITLLKFNITTDKIIVSHKMINYEQRAVDEASKVQISLENLSKLSMKYGFIMLPKEFSVKTNIDYLLSNEKKFLDVIYTPKDNFTGHREGDIFCRVVTSKLTNQNIKIRYHIELINLEVKVTPKFIKFESLPEKEYKEIFFVVENTNDSKAFDCEWLTPPKCISGLTIMPKVFTIEPKKYTTCILRFESEFREYGPFSFEEVEKEIGIKLADGLNQMEKEEVVKGKNEALEEKIEKEVNSKLEAANEAAAGGKKGKAPAKEDKKKEVKKPEPKKDKKALEEEERKQKEEEEQRLREEQEKKEQRIKEFDKEEELRHFGAETTFREVKAHRVIKDSKGDPVTEEVSQREAHWKFIVPLFYRIHFDQSEILNKNINLNEIPIKSSFVQIETSTVEKVLLFDKEELNFGEVSVNTKKLMDLWIENTSDKVAKIRVKPLILTNCFRTVNVISQLNPGEKKRYLMEFLPIKDLPYYEEFTVFTEDTQSTIKLKGVGVMPDVDTSVDSSGVVFLGNTVVNNVLEKSFDILNKSPFTIHYNLVTLKSGKKNKSGLKPFCFIPSSGDIEGNGKVTVNVTFNGDHQDFENFFEFVLVDVPNQKKKEKDNKILFQAYCWDRQVYWKVFNEILFPNPVDTFMDKVIEQDVFVDCLKLKSTSKSSNNDTLFLMFDRTNKGKPEEEPNERCFKRKIVLGNCKMNDPKNEKNGNYEIIMDKDDPYFVVDNPKGALNGGAEVIVTFTFKKPALDPLTSSIACLDGIGMWVTSKAELKINGGYIAPNAQDAVSVTVVLKAYINNV
ncbi:MAG: hypothetical protein MJ252_11415 [archaeon]|nr:hypothetical protein [archaeon]